MLCYSCTGLTGNDNGDFVCKHINSGHAAQESVTVYGKLSTNLNTTTTKKLSGIPTRAVFVDLHYSRKTIYIVIDVHYSSTAFRLNVSFLNCIAYDNQITCI